MAENVLAALAGMLLSQAATPEPRLAEPAAISSLALMPDTVVHYYDVAGTDITSINRSIARQRQSIGGRPVPASTDWTVSATFEKRVDNGRCRIESAQARFAATASLPRLVDEHKLDRPTLERWRKFVASLESSGMASLVFVQQRLGRVEQAILASPCEKARDAAAAAVATLEAEAAAFERARLKAARNHERVFGDSQAPEAKAVKPICRTLHRTGSRIENMRVCMAPAEWVKLENLGEETTKELQNKPRTNRAF